MIACVDVDRGILMTFGSGAYGCLGHGNSNDVSQVYLLSVCLSAVTVGTGSVLLGSCLSAVTIGTGSLLLGSHWFSSC